MSHNKDPQLVAAEDGLAGYESGSPHPDSNDDSSVDPDSGVKRGLKNRHLSMMALAGIIGPGLLVGAGGALNSGGPASLLIGFGVIGMFLCEEIKCVGKRCRDSETCDS